MHRIHERVAHKLLPCCCFQVLIDALQQTATDTVKQLDTASVMHCMAPLCSIGENKELKRQLTLFGLGQMCILKNSSGQDETICKPKKSECEDDGF
jgi:hypothetical protein